MPHHLVVNAPDSEPIHYVLRANRIGVGRGKDNQICIDCRSVSTCHLEITKNEAGECWLEDLDSVNGTTVNGEILYGSIELRDGDRILIGDAVGAHYFLPSQLMEESPDFVLEVDFPLSKDLVILSDKVFDLENQVKILNGQYSQKLEEFQSLVMTLEKLKIAMDENLQGEDAATSVERVIEELERAKSEIALNGINISDREIAFEEETPRNVDTKGIRWLK